MTPIFFVVVYTTGCILTLFRHPVFGLYTYVFTFYLSPAHNWWGRSLPDLRYLLIAALLTLISFLIRRATRPDTRWTTLYPGKALLVFAVYLWLQTFWAIDRVMQIEGAITFTKHTIIFYLIFHLLNTERRFRDFLLLHITGCFYFGYLALDAGGGRLETVGGPVGNDSNELGQHLATTAILGGVWWIAQSHLIRAHITLCMPFIVNGIILTVSRGALLGFVLGGATAGAFMPKTYRSTFLMLSFAAVVLIGILAHDELVDRINSTFDALLNPQAEMDNSAESRKDIFMAGMYIGIENPMGAGFRATRQLSVAYLSPEYLASGGRGKAAHNTFAAAFAEHGIFGAAFYLSIVAWVLLTVRETKVRQSEVDPRSTALTAGIGAALVSLFISGNTSNNLFLETQYWLLALLCANLANRNLTSTPATDSKTTRVKHARSLKIS